MSLAPGTRLGVFEITAPIGAGGMGEVYRARDTRLDRDVAIKVLPEALAGDRDRVARFDREARTLASLNHPNIAAIYGVEETSGTVALALEYVDGEDLAARLTRGPLAVDEALGIARQIADGLEAAHDRGIVHRDLKPANIKIGREGTVKILDFGLAKALEAEGSSSSSLANSPTMMSPTGATVHGMILGTAAYMAPEQARGGAVDRRADLWAFGVVLIEMLTGVCPFAADTVSDTLAAVLTREIDWTRLPADTPAPVRRLLRRCLEKDRRRRLGDAATARLEIEEALAGARDDTAAANAHPEGRRSLVRTLAGVALLTVAVIVLVAGALRWSNRSASTSPTRLSLTIVPPDGAPLRPVGIMSSVPILSPDGSAILFQSTAADLWVRRLDSLEATKLSGAYEVVNEAFWHGSSRITFPARDSAGAHLVEVRLPDGAATVLTRFVANTRSGSWNDAGRFILGGYGTLTGEAGGEPTPVTGAGGTAEYLLYPQFLPGSDDLLAAFQDSDGAPVIGLVTLRGGVVTNKTVLLENSTAGRYTPAGGGRVLFVRDDDLYGQRVNLAARALVGEPELLVRGVASQPGLMRASFSVADNGTIAWRPGRAALAQVTVFNRQGAQVATAGPPGAINSVLASPGDEPRLLVSVANAMWLVSVGETARTILRDEWWNWAPDGRRLLGLRANEIVARDVNGGPSETIGGVARTVYPSAISPDGQFVLGRLNSLVSWARLSEMGDAKAWKPMSETDENQGDSSFSPDGRFVLYDAGGRLYVQPFPSPSRRQLIAEGGRDPVWRGDGREILYSTDDSVWSVAVRGGPGAATFAAPVRLFGGVRRAATSVFLSRGLAVSRDGSQIFLAQGVEQPESQIIHVMIGALSP